MADFYTAKNVSLRTQVEEAQARSKRYGGTNRVHDHRHGETCNDRCHDEPVPEPEEETTDGDDPPLRYSIP